MRVVFLAGAIAQYVSGHFLSLICALDLIAALPRLRNGPDVGHQVPTTNTVDAVLMSAEITTGPFLHRVDDCWRRSTARHGTYLILIARGYDTRGFQDRANNGIAILDEQQRSVVLDGHDCAPLGVEIPTDSQLGQVRRILSMSDSDLARFCVAHARFRGESSAPQLAALAARSRADRTLTEILAASLAHAPERKREFHSVAKQVLRELAMEGLGLKPREFEIRVEPEGPASAGYVYLQTEQSCVLVFQWKHVLDNVIYRTCNGMTGRGGGQNHYATVEELHNVVQFAERLRKLKHPTVFTYPRP